MGESCKAGEETNLVRFRWPREEPMMAGVGGTTPGVVTVVHLSLVDASLGVSTTICWSSSSFTLPVRRPGQGGTTKLVGAGVGALSCLCSPKMPFTCTRRSPLLLCGRLPSGRWAGGTGATQHPGSLRCRLWTKFASYGRVRSCKLCCREALCLPSQCWRSPWGLGVWNVHPGSGHK